MKIAFVSPYYPSKCGIATYTDYLIRSIKKQDADIEIKVVAEHGASSIKTDKFEVIPCWNRDEDYVKPIISNSKDADIIHIQHEYGIYNFDDRLPLVLSGLKTNRKVLTIHCVRPAQISEKGAMDEDFAARISRIADKIIVHLDSQKSILERLGISSKRICVIPHGTEVSNESKRFSREKLGLPSDTKMLLLFGFIAEHKCQHIVLEALVDILEKINDVYLLMAGCVSPRAAQKHIAYSVFLQKRILELGIQKNVITQNRFIPSEDVPYLLGASDIALFPYCENDRSASGSIHVALGAGKPVIASRIPKFEELRYVSDELLVLPNNPSEITNLTIRLFEDLNFKNYISKRIEEFRQSTSWQTTAMKHLELYNNLKSFKKSKEYETTKQPLPQPKYAANSLQ